MFVLHEFLEQGRDGVVKVLESVRRDFPDKFVLVLEVYRWSVPQLIRKPAPVAEHHLFHRLSKQCLGSVKEWKSMFEEAGFIVELLEYFDSEGKFHFVDWDVGSGKINRSKRFDERNRNGILRYTSIILDAYKTPRSI